MDQKPDQKPYPSVELPPALLLRRLIASYRITHVIKAAAELGLADHLGEAPESAAGLAARLRVDATNLHRLLRALASLGLVAETGEDRFALTPVGACLRSDAPSGMRNWALCEGAGYYQRAWLDLPHAVRTGETAIDHAWGTSFYRYLGEHAATGRDFSRAMADFAGLIAGALVDGYDFSGVRRVVDVGGSHGRLLRAILEANPGTSGVLFDRAPGSLPDASDRYAIVAGDFLEAVPEGGDLYLLSRILMDHDDERCVRILRNCHRAMATDGRVLIVQLIVPPRGSQAPPEALFEPVISDINMMVLTGGRERTEEEYRGLLERAGLRWTRTIPSPALVSFLEGVRV